ncbi:MAG: S8 family serine peptidase [Polyangiaceae bacterium]
MGPAVRPARSKPSGSSWSPRPRTEGREPRDGGSWFLGAAGGGVDADRPITGTGAGTRLAVIDDDAAGAAALALDAELLVDLVAPPRAQAHGSLMVAWAVGAARAEPPFRGVAPDASPRLYLIPKPGLSVVSLPLAIVRAVRDGADAIVCATYVEGTWSPLFDDALAYAERCGRAGRGTVVVLPAGREASSPPGSVHASFTLSFGDPAADPARRVRRARGHRGGWFFYRDRKQRARPFANRGPSVRLLAPGDDVAYPLDPTGRLSHAESSGASAIAAGVAALVLAVNPTLRLRELIALLETTARDVDPAADPALAPFADLHDTRPSSLDADRHNAKHGYGASPHRAPALPPPIPSPGRSSASARSPPRARSTSSAPAARPRPPPRILKISRAGWCALS